MKKIFSFVFFLFFTALAFGQKVVNDPNAEARQVSGFTGLSVSNAFDVILTQGNEEAVAVSAADKDDIARIKTEVSGGVLKIWYDQDKKIKWGKDKKLKAYVSVKTLNKLKVSGACDIKIEGQLSSSSLQIELSGASDVNGKIVVANDLKVELSGASDLTISGSANSVNIEASGASDFRAYEFTAGSCKVEASGASGVTITVERELSAELSGASSVSYKGSASVKSIKTSGASSINKKS
jgi:hypothetical protein